MARMEHRRPSLVAFALLSIVLAACGGEKTSSNEPAPQPEKKLAAPPSNEVAFAALSDAPEFGDYKFTRAGYSLPMRADLLKGPARESADDLAKAGWVAFDAGGNLTLTAKAIGDKRFIVRPNESLDIVPLAKKELVSVDGMGHDDEGDVTVDFTWRWLPNEVAGAFNRGEIAKRFDGDQKARATIYTARDGWKVLRIVEIEQTAEPTD